ncbi:MAG TPA: mechanosensitive ion channel, partial [Ilumatobacteraceae bacterium]|nr:mechanosensitive ion channel [Ilumatobacteraceae bacterium]
MGAIVVFSSVLAASSRPGWVRRLDELHLLTPLRMVLVIAAAIAVTAFVRRMAGRWLDRMFQRAGPADQPRALARHETLSSALRAAVIGVVWAVAVITVISEAGVNIGAFVATATVIGGAIAFGAQTLIRDVIGGFFVLADDQFGVGDEVDLGQATGVVERVT